MQKESCREEEGLQGLQEDKGAMHRNQKDALYTNVELSEENVI